jgi:hypothetical protein
MKTYYIITNDNSMIEIEALNEQDAIQTAKLFGLKAVKIAH